MPARNPKTREKPVSEYKLGIDHPEWKPGLPRKICGADKGGGNICRLPAGYRTDHKGYGGCIWHYGSTSIGKQPPRRSIRLPVRWLTSTRPEPSWMRSVARPGT
jgi:hypothetical protein